ncbi:hypothetical protein BMS3Abin07_01333 [bacterium BMS3Abin07]|nr:hypothetical protein BMS3Abin07_01333 [bacterium BMS3Abin07]
MTVPDKRILIIDEAGFSRICTAILEFQGFGVETIADMDYLLSSLNNGKIGLAIISYPFGADMIDEIRKREIPTIILSDHINRDLINILEFFGNCYCMLKPLNYQKFRSLVGRIMDSGMVIKGEYNIV